jgi:hypothetical protein
MRCAVNSAADDCTALAKTSDLFAPERWPRRPYCADEKGMGTKIRDFQRALTKPYIQANPPHLRVWSIFDIDRPGAAIAWEDADLPPPTWAAMNPENGHAHLVWGLLAPVLVDGLEARQGPLRYLVAIERMMRERLTADLGYSGLLTKNPSHPRWRVLRGPVQAYELRELAEWLPGVEKFIPKRGRTYSADEVGLGRNVTLFDRLREWAYRAIRGYWGEGQDVWLAACNGKALNYNGDFITPLDPREVGHIAKSVAKWTWREHTQQGFSAWQSSVGRRGGVASGKARRAKNEARRTEALEMLAGGVTQASVARTLGVHANTIANWLREARSTA